MMPPTDTTLPQVNRWQGSKLSGAGPNAVVQMESAARALLVPPTHCTFLSLSPVKNEKRH